VPDQVDTPSGLCDAPAIMPPGAKMVLISVLRCENEMIRSGPVE
jgi:hypothetical protein